MSDGPDNPAARESLFRAMLAHPVPGGASWRHALGMTTALLLLVQIVTGVLLMTVYSPSSATAWGSVWYIQTQVPAGWLIRGLHHFSSDAVLIVIALHVLQIIVAGAYRSPRGAVWVISLALLAIVLALSLTGHLLPWDQAGYWGTKVRTNILSRTPLIGEALKRLFVGGSELGQLTLTRFYTLHVVVLPGILAGLLAWRYRQNRLADSVRPAGSESSTGRIQELYFHRQFFLDTLAFTAVMACVLGVLAYVRTAWQSELLDAPADAAATNYPARPEWHTLFLYQWLQYFPGPRAGVVAAVAAPSLLALLYLAFPIMDRRGGRSAGRFCVVAITGVTLAGMGWLNYAAVKADSNPADAAVQSARSKQAAGEDLTKAEKLHLQARQYHQQVARARRAAARSLELAATQGIPPTGALALMRNDSWTRGPELFAAHCASCHRYNGHDGLGSIPAEPPTSSDLYGFASRSWIRGLLRNPMTDTYFGQMKKPDGKPAHTRMRKFLRELKGDNEEDDARRRLSADLDAVAAYLEDESLRPGRLANVDLDADESVEPVGAAGELILRGRRYFLSVCNECHSYDGYREGTFHAPEMRGYGSVEWIMSMIADPSHDSLYRNRGKQPAQMPSFANRLTGQDIRLLAGWIHEDRADE